ISLGDTAFSLNRARIALKGGHNAENVAAAALAALGAGADPEAVKRAAYRFRGLPHRLEFVAEKNGVAFYDDSKATNVDAVVRALESFDSPVVLLMGGRDKGASFELLKDSLANVKLLVAFGEAGPVVKKALSPFVSVAAEDTVPKAVAVAARAAQKGWAVLLSPGCASFDQYPGYAARGDDFKRAVRAL
ncbi:MAG: UDP-N-acetylmuramoyl-L-alanine--D-glutamate ligase, partial [Deltaproteobacteria bacterium]|nr:UDP-N-acetylmuramoyl-L-alanine--D-glutamate ligase [Deltaproteobacteria bacterium]